MKVTYEFLEHGWVKVGDRVKINDEECVINYIAKLQVFEHGSPTEDYKYILHGRQGINIYQYEEFRRDKPSTKDVEVIDAGLTQARIAEFAAAKLKEANKVFQSLKEQLKDLKDLVS